jgi:hypothetical protein
MTTALLAAKVVFLIAFVIVSFELFMWAQKFLKRPITSAYVLKSLAWAVILDIPFFVWFFG